MKTYNTGGMRRGLTAVLSAFVAVVGLGLLGYASLGVGSPASAAKSEVTPRPPPQTTPELTVPEMKRAGDVPVHARPKENKAALRKGTLHVKGNGYPRHTGATDYTA